MKTLKNLFFLATLFISMATFKLNAVRIGEKSGPSAPPCPFSAVVHSGAPYRDYEFELEQHRLATLQELRKKEKSSFKALTKIAGNAALNKLLAIASDTEKAAELNRLPTELKQYLITLIDTKMSLLDEKNPTEKDQIDALDSLQNLIIDNIGESLVVPETFEKFPKLMEID